MWPLLAFNSALYLWQLVVKVARTAHFTILCELKGIGSMVLRDPETKNHKKDTTLCVLPKQIIIIINNIYYLFEGDLTFNLKCVSFSLIRGQDAFKRSFNLHGKKWMRTTLFYKKGYVSSTVIVIFF